MKYNIVDKNTWKNKILTLLASLSLALFLLSFSVILTLRMDFTYRFTSPTQEEMSLASSYGYNLSKETMNENYKNLINYMFSNMESKLEFKDLPMSDKGRIHFFEVKVIFQSFMKLMAITLVISSILSIYLIRKKSFKFLKYSSILTATIPLLLSIPAIIDFNKIFVLFHKIAFSNDYWIFDPSYDPIILYLPESLFMINTFIILSLLILFILLTSLLYKKCMKNPNSH